MCIQVSRPSVCSSTGSKRVFCWVVPSQIQKIAQAQGLKPGKLFSILKEPISEVCLCGERISCLMAPVHVLVLLNLMLKVKFLLLYNLISNYRDYLHVNMVYVHVYVVWYWGLMLVLWYGPFPQTRYHGDN